MAETYFADVAKMARRGGLPALAEFWERVFEDECRAQPDADAQVALKGNELVIRVHGCPAFVWMGQNGRRPCECYSDQCLVFGRALAEAAGLEFDIEGGDGACVQRLRRAEAADGASLIGHERTR